MASETELERLVVRLIGDNASYKRMLKQSTTDTKTYTDKMGRVHDAATGKFAAGQKRMQFSLKQTAKAMKSTGAAMQSMGMKMSLKVTAPIVAMGAMAAKSFASFDQAMTESTSIMKVTTDQIARMRDTALSLSSSGAVIQGPTEMAKSYFYLASAGKNAEQSMALLPKMAAFATAGAFDMALATDLATDAQSALGLASKDVTKDTEGLVRVTDVLVKANTLANATVQQFSESITNTAGATLKSYNKTIEEGVAVLAAYADQGVKGQIAGTNLSRITLLLSKAARRNAEEHKKLGFAVFDASGKMRNYADIIQNIEDVTRGMSDEQKSATLHMLGFEARVQQAILPLLGTSKAIREYESELKKAGGTTQQVSERQMKSFSNQMTQIWNKIKVVAIDIGQTLSPMIISLGKHVTSLVGKWTGLNDGTKKYIITVAALTAAIGPLLLLLGTMTSMTGLVIGGIANIAMATRLLSVAFVGLGISATAGWAAVTLGVSLAIPAIIGIVLGLKKLQSQFNIFGPIVEGAKELWKVVKDSLGPALNEIGQIVMKDVLPSLMEIGKAMLMILTPQIRAVAQVIVTVLKMALQQFSVFLKIVVLPLVNQLATALKIVGDSIGWIMEKVGGGTSSATNAVTKTSVKSAEKAGMTETDARNLLTVGGYSADAARAGLPTPVSAVAESNKKALEKASKDLQKGIKDYYNDLDKAMAIQSTYGGGSTADVTRFQDQLHELEYAGANPEVVAYYQQQLDYYKQSVTYAEQLADAEKKRVADNKAYWGKMEQQGKALIAANLTPLEKYNKAVQDIQELWQAGALGSGPMATVFGDRAIAKAKKEYDDAIKDKNVKVNVSLEYRNAVSAGSAEALARLNEFRQGKMFSGNSTLATNTNQTIAPVNTTTPSTSTTQGAKVEQREENIEKHLRELVVLARKHWKGGAGLQPANL